MLGRPMSRSEGLAKLRHLQMHFAYLGPIQQQQQQFTKHTAIRQLHRERESFASCLFIYMQLFLKSQDKNWKISRLPINKPKGMIANLKVWTLAPDVGNNLIDLFCFSLAFFVSVEQQGHLGGKLQRYKNWNKASSRPGNWTSGKNWSSHLIQGKFLQDSWGCQRLHYCTLLQVTTSIGTDLYKAWERDDKEGQSLHLSKVIKREYYFGIKETLLENGGPI